MAVAAWEGSLTLYSLKPMGQLKEEVEVDGKLLDDQFMPVKSVCASIEYISKWSVTDDSLKGETLPG